MIASCVRKFDDSLNSAIHNTYRGSLRSLSLQKPMYSPSRFLIFNLNDQVWDPTQVSKANERLVKYTDEEQLIFNYV